MTLARSQMPRRKKPLRSADTAARKRHRARLHEAKAERGPTVWDLIKEAQSKTARVVKMRDGHVCRQCHASGAVRHDDIIDAGHFYPKAMFPAVRFELNNIFGQCRGCNLRHIRQPLLMREWFVETFGYEALEALHARAVQPHKFTREELQAIIAERDEQIAIYELTRAA